MIIVLLKKAEMEGGVLELVWQQQQCRAATQPH
jgi:hypothetical protein